MCISSHCEGRMGIWLHHTADNGRFLIKCEIDDVRRSHILEISSTLGCKSEIAARALVNMSFAYRILFRDACDLFGLGKEV